MPPQTQTIESDLDRPLSVEHLAALREEAPPEGQPQELLIFAHHKFGGRLALATSLGPQSLVLLHMLHELELPIPIFFLDTGLLFEETYLLRRKLELRYDVRIEAVRPAKDLYEQECRSGAELWIRHPSRCCALRKVDPMRKVLKGLGAWISGVRRDQSATREHSSALEWDEQFGLFKLNPLVRWTRAQVQRYLEVNRIPYNPLLDQGYPSVGCVPCTLPVNPSLAVLNERAGRWAGHSKTECGLHIAVEETEAMGGL